MEIKKLQKGTWFKTPALENPPVNEPRKAKLVQPAQVTKSTSLGNGSWSLSLISLQMEGSG